MEKVINENVGTAAEDGNTSSSSIEGSPTLLTSSGKLDLRGNKCNLLKFLKPSEDPPKFDAKILDAAVIINFLSPCQSMSTFRCYSNHKFLNYVTGQLKTTSRLDIVWDVYREDSLKSHTREKRGTGHRVKVEIDEELPEEWHEFLRNSKNKSNLFSLLTQQIVEKYSDVDKPIYVTSGENVINLGTEVAMEDCNHEEADTRIVVHIIHALQNGCKTVMIRTIDTDVVVILLGCFHKIIEINSDASIWVRFGNGENIRFYHINYLYTSLGHEKSIAMPLFHAFTGCDTTSSLRGVGKITAWDAWEDDDELTEVFCNFANDPFEEIDESSMNFLRLEQFTAHLYDKKSDALESVRKNLFSRKNPPKNKIPPSKEELLQHVLRTLLQAGIWINSNQNMIQTPYPENFGWHRDNDMWIPKYTNIQIHES